jgi:hypothetical protein
MQFVNRGQAYIETAIFLPLFLLILFGVIWIVQASVVEERLQFAVRYSGLISNTSSPYSAWSLYSLYENTLYPGTTQATRTCYAPQSGVLTNSSPFPGPTSAPFWRPAAVPLATCSPAHFADDSLTDEPGLYNEMAPSMSASAAIPSFLRLGASSTTMTAQETFLGAPDFTTMTTCYATWAQNITNSLGNEALGGGVSTTVAPQALSNNPTETPLTSSC